MFTVSVLAMRFIFRFILLFKLAYLIHFLSFFCLSLLSFTLFFMPMSGSFFYFLLNTSLIISHVPLLPISFFHILSFHEDCMQSDCLLASHSSLFVDLPSHIKTVGKVLPVIEEAPPIISSLPAWQELAANRRSPAGSPDAYRCTIAMQVGNRLASHQGRHTRFVFTSLWTLTVSLFISISIVSTCLKTAALASHRKTRCSTEHNWQAERHCSWNGSRPCLELQLGGGEGDICDCSSIYCESLPERKHESCREQKLSSGAYSSGKTLRSQTRRKTA